MVPSMRPAPKGIMAGSATVAAYLLVVVVTTPALDPLPAINAALQINSIVIAGMGVGIGLQVFLSEKARMIGCSLGARGRAFGGNSGGATTTSFFSFFSLVPLGCCGWWLYLLSLLPGVLGTGVSAVLIQHSQALAYLGLAVVFGFVGMAAYRLRRQEGIRRASPGV